MFEKIEKVIKEIESSESISGENKPLIIEKIKEWRAEDSAISEISTKLESWWLEVEPIFAGMGLV
jgi:hypothetical protein